MCRRTQCPTCHKPTWTGCGAHVEKVLGDVAPADRCTCKASSAKTPVASEKSWLQKLRSK